MARRGVAGLLPVDFFTQGYRISGHVQTRVQTVGDLLNDRLTSYMEVSDVYISRITAPGEIVATYGQAQLRKDGLLFAIVPSKESLSRSGRSTSYFGRQRRHVWISLSTFEIEGDFQITGLSLDWRAFLIKSVSTYIPIMDATARVAALPEISFGGEAFLVNRECIDLFCMEEDGS